MEPGRGETLGDRPRLGGGRQVGRRARELVLEVGAPSRGDLVDDARRVQRSDRHVAVALRDVRVALGAQPLEQIGRKAGVDRERGLLDAALELLDLARHQERRAGIEQDDVALRPGLAAEDRLDRAWRSRRACRRRAGSSA